MRALIIALCSSFRTQFGNSIVDTFFCDAAYEKVTLRDATSDFVMAVHTRQKKQATLVVQNTGTTRGLYSAHYIL